MNKTKIWGNKLLALLLISVMVLGVFPLLPINVQSAGAGGQSAPHDPDGSALMRELGISTGAPIGYDTRRNLSPYGRDKLTLLPVGEVNVNLGLQNILYGHNVSVKDNIFTKGSISRSDITQRSTASNQVAFDYEGKGQKDWIALYYYIRESSSRYTFAVVAFHPVTGQKRELYSQTYTNAAICGYFEGAKSKDQLLGIAAGNFNDNKYDSLAIVTYERDYNDSSRIMLAVSTLTGSPSGSGEWNFNLVSGEFVLANSTAATISLTSGDLNNDGIDDLAVTRGTYGSVRVYLSTTTVFFGDPYDQWNVIFGYCFSTSAIVPNSRERKIFAGGSTIGDVDGDGKNELIVGGVTNSMAGWTTNDYWDLPSLYGWSHAIDVYKYSGGALSLHSEGRFSISSGRPDYDRGANLAVARMDGLNTPGHLFLDNRLYKYNGNAWSRTKDLTTLSEIKSGTFKGSMAVGADHDGDRKDSILWKVPYDSDSHLILVYNSDGTYRNALSYPNTSSSMSFSVPNTDNDSPVLELLEHSLHYSDPIILAAVASSPYYKDLEEIDTANYMESSTSFGKGSGTGGGYERATTKTDGLYISISQDFEFFGVPAANFEFETEFTSSLTGSVSRYTEVSETITYSTYAGQDSFVVYSYPTDVFRYKIKEPNQNGTGFTGDEENMCVVVPYSPVSAVVDAKLYNSVTEKYDLANRENAGDVFSHIVGYPETYPREGDHVNGNNVYTPNGWVNMSFGNSSVTQELEITEQMTEGTQWSSAITFKGGGGPANTTIGGISSTEESHAKSTTNIKTMVYTAEMVNFPSAAQGLGAYGFQWRMMQYTYSRVQTFPMLTYQVRGVSTPPTLPEDVSWTTTDTSITLTWTDSQRSAAARAATEGYEATLKVGASTENMTITQEGGVYTAKTPEGLSLSENTFFDVGLVAKNSSKRSVAQIFNIRTNRRGMGVVHFSEYTDAPVNVNTVEAVISVKGRRENTAPFTTYKWQVRSGDGNFADVTFGTGAEKSVPGEFNTSLYTLTVANPHSRMNEYRLLIIQEDNGITYEIYSDIILIRSENKYSLTIPYLEGQTTGAGEYYGGEFVTLTAPETIQEGYTFYDWDIFLGGDTATWSFTMPDRNVVASPGYKTENANAMTWLRITNAPEKVVPGEQYKLEAEITGTDPLNTLWWRISNTPTSSGTYIESDGTLHVGEDETLAAIRISVFTICKLMGGIDRNLQDHAEIETGVRAPYDEEPTNRLRAFLMQFSNGKRNADHLGWDMMDPATWDGVNWRFNMDGELNIADSIDWDASENPDFANLTGSFDLSNISIRSIDIRGTGITEIDLSGSGMVIINLDDNKITDLIIKNTKGIMYGLNAQGNPISNLDLEGSDGFRSYNLQGSNLTQDEVDSLPKQYPFSLYYNDKYLIEFSPGGRKIEVDIEGDPDIQLINSNDSFNTWIRLRANVKDYTLITDLTQYPFIEDEGSSIKWGETEVTHTIRFFEPEEDKNLTLKYLPQIHLPEAIFMDVYPVLDRPLVTSLAGTDMYSIDISWSPKDTVAVRNKEYTVAIKIVPKGDFGTDYLDGKDGSQYYNNLFYVPGMNPFYWGDIQYDAQESTYTATVTTGIVPSYNMSFEVDGKKAGMEGANYSVPNTSWGDIRLSNICLRNESNVEMWASYSVLGEYAERFFVDSDGGLKQPGEYDNIRLIFSTDPLYGIPSGTHFLLLKATLTNPMGGDTVEGTLPVLVTVTEGMTTSPSAAYTFPAMYEGYSTVSKEFEIRNNRPGNISAKPVITLTGQDSGHFVIEPYGWTEMETGAGVDFITVSAKPGLAPGTYSATLNIIIEGEKQPSVDLSFTVLSAALPPQVASVSPFDDYKNTSVPARGDLLIRFNKPMNTGAAGEVYIGTTALGGGTWSEGGKVYKVPYSLDFDEMNTLTISGFRDTSGSVTQTASQRFTSEENILPGINSGWVNGWVDIPVHKRIHAVGRGPFTWNLEGELPAGLHLTVLDAGGRTAIISGTPEETAEYGYIPVKIVGALGASVDTEIRISIGASPMGVEPEVESVYYSTSSGAKDTAYVYLSRPLIGNENLIVALYDNKGNLLDIITNTAASSLSNREAQFFEFRKNEKAAKLKVMWWKDRNTIEALHRLEIIKGDSEWQ